MFQLSYENGMVTIVISYNSSWSHVDWCKVCSHLRSLNIRHFGLVEATGLKKYGVEITFNVMTSLLNFVKSTNGLRNYWWGGGENTDAQADRQHGDIISFTFPSMNYNVKPFSLIINDIFTLCRNKRHTTRRETGYGGF
jgi:hypothetical protein